MGDLATHEFETIDYRAEDGVAWVVLNRPEVHNAFNVKMQQELHTVWRGLRDEDDVNVAILTGAGDKAFCTGIDRAETMGDLTEDNWGDRKRERKVGSQSTPFHFEDPGDNICPKTNELWKPVIAAVNGMACGGALYMLGEVDVIIAAEHATFFDPHVTYGMAAVFETMHIMQKMPFGEALRMQLMGAHERMSAARAYQIGLVSEVVPGDELDAAALRVASAIASQPTLAVQATVRSAWTAHDLGRAQGLRMGRELVNAGTARESILEGQATFSSGKRLEWRLR